MSTDERYEASAFSRRCTTILIWATTIAVMFSILAIGIGLQFRTASGWQFLAISATALAYSLSERRDELDFVNDSPRTRFLELLTMGTFAWVLWSVLG